MKFIGEFIKEIGIKKQGFQKLFGLDDNRSNIETVLKEELENHWNPLSEPMNLFNEEYSVDSSSASRTLSNGIDFFIIRALMIGTNNYNQAKLRFEMVKGIRDYNIITSFERILRDLIEIEIVLDKIEDIPENSIVMIDGNLYGRYTHLMNELRLKGWYHLPLDLLSAMQNLFVECEKRGIMVVGVSKFSKTRVLTKALLNKRFPSIGDPEFLDVELLYRWKNRETGYTTPLLIGDYALSKEITQLEQEPVKYREKHFNSVQLDRIEWATQVISKIPYSPAIVMFHIIPKVDAQPLRIDIPANCLDIQKKITEVRPFEFVDLEKVKAVTQQISSDFGGRDVYNALLYIVDKEVRLSGKTVDRVYKSVLGKELGFQIEYNRSTRRFSN